MIVFYAGGNSGHDKTTSVESTSKNAISVESGQSTFDSANIGFISYFSSKGPAYDGRIKPDITAPGDATMSARSNGGAGASCQTTEKTGKHQRTQHIIIFLQNFILFYLILYFSHFFSFFRLHFF